MKTFEVNAKFKDSDAVFTLKIVENGKGKFFYWNKGFHKFGYRENYHLFGKFGIRLVNLDFMEVKDEFLENEFVLFFKQKALEDRKLFEEKYTFFLIEATKKERANSGTDSYSYAFETLGGNVDFDISETITAIIKEYKKAKYIAKYKSCGFSVNVEKVLIPYGKESISFSRYDPVEGDTGLFLPKEYAVNF